MVLQSTSFQSSDRDGDVVEYRQDPIPDSKFHAELEAQAEGASPPADTSVREEKFRYWSDYSMVYYHPRSLQRLPDPPDWEDSEGEWGSGGEMFERQDEVSYVLDYIAICKALSHSAPGYRFYGRCIPILR